MKPAPAGERSQGLAATTARQREDDAPGDTISAAWPEPRGPCRSPSAASASGKGKQPLWK